MSHVPSVDAASIKPAERKFRWFFAISHIVFGMIVLATLVGRGSEFWRGNICWTWGSSLIAISVIQTRFYSIRKMANPQNRNIDVFRKSGFNRRLGVVETGVNLYWVGGFCLIALSRWLKW